MLFPYAIPKSGFTGYGGASCYTQQDLTTSHNRVSTSEYAQKYPLGTIIGYFNATLGGYGACAYMKFDNGDAVACVAGDVLTMLAGTFGSAGHTEHTTLTTDISAGMTKGGIPMAIALTAMTDGYYGWFWMLGVCPDFYVSSSAKFSTVDINTENVSLEAGEAFGATVDTTLDEYTNAETCGVAGVSLVADSSNVVNAGEIRLTGLGWGV